MLRSRLMMGIPLAVGVIGLLLLDGWLSTLTGDELRRVGLPPPAGRWLTNGLVVTALVLVLMLLGTRELLRFTRSAGYNPFGPLSYLFSAGLIAGPYVAFNLREAGLHSEGWGLLWLTLALGTAFLIQATYRKAYHTIENLSTTLFIIFYVGVLSGFFVKLRMEVGGAEGIIVTLFSVFVVKMTDVGAYFVGSALGRHKMIAWLSPRKTWEGFVGGFVVAMVVAWAIGYPLCMSGWIDWPFHPAAAHVWMIIFGLVMGAFAIAGDLCASLLKRDAAMKDSGTTLGGLGGVLDVMDSPLLAAPAAWFFWTRLREMLEATVNAPG